VGIAFTSFLFIWAISQDNKIVTSISLAILWFVEIILLIRYINLTNRNLLFFLNSIQLDDTSITFNKNRKLPFKSLYEEFNRIVILFDKLKTEKEIEHQYFEHIIKHAETGLCAWDSNERIHLFNKAAKILLKLPHITSLSGLKAVNEELPARLLKMKPGKQELLSLYVRISEFNLGEENIKLATFQNIHPELEEKESEAWQKLIKVLTHEIVNSVSPIKLVSSTLMKSVETREGLKSGKQLTAENIKNIHEGLNAIYNRSIGLSKFVDDYKTITDIPKPNFETVRVEDFIQNIIVLLKEGIIKSNIDLVVNIDPKDQVLVIDKKMMEQVIINLIKNAVHSLTDRINPQIKINGYEERGRYLMSIEDNGCGIPFNTLDYIFMPFFTTKKGGSGIGLTLSRQIMKAHDGLMSVVSKEEEGTTTTMIF
jgi:nitrogen fixation/metabolism regulation signal transduction histidine kinase